MAISESQLSANRANAQLSTGPRTEAGKNASRLNATRHGVTRQVMIMPEPQMQAYRDFEKEHQIAWAPANHIELQLVQTLIDTQWRMSSGRAWELSLFADTHEKFADRIETERPEVQDAMAAMQALTYKADQLRLLSLYEQRINRTFQTTFKQLREVQAERKEREEKEMHQASMIQRMMKMKGETYNPADDGFVISTKRFERFQSHETHFSEAVIAANAGYNLEKFKAAVAKQ
jgi:hypothetical protein